MTLLPCVAAACGPRPETAIDYRKCGEHAADEMVCLWYNPAVAELVARPDWYSRHPVRVFGFVSVRYENVALYPTRDDFDHANARSAIWVVLTSAQTKQYGQLDGKWTMVSGTFDGRPGPNFAASIRDVAEIREVFASREPAKGAPRPVQEK